MDDKDFEEFLELPGNLAFACFIAVIVLVYGCLGLLFWLVTIVLPPETPGWLWLIVLLAFVLLAFVGWAVVIALSYSLAHGIWNRYKRTVKRMNSDVNKRQKTARDKARKPVDSDYDLD